MNIKEVSDLQVFLRRFVTLILKYKLNKKNSKKVYFRFNEIKCEELSIATENYSRCRGN